VNFSGARSDFAMIGSLPPPREFRACPTHKDFVEFGISDFNHLSQRQDREESIRRYEAHHTSLPLHTESLSNAGRKRILNTRNYATSRPTRKLIIKPIQKCRQRSLLSAPPLRTWLPASTPSTCTREYVVSITQNELSNCEKERGGTEGKKEKQRR
jgi:hypothetical protein